MRSQPVLFELADTADERFDPLIEAGLIGLMAFCPLALGAVQPWSETIVLLLCSALVLTMLVKLLTRPDVRFVWSRTYLPIAAFVLLVLIQLVPLPAGMVRVLSPATVSLPRELLGSFPGSAPAPGWMALGFLHEQALADLRLILAASAVYVVCINVIRRLEQIRRMLAAVAVIGTIVALLALLQDTTDADAIYWVIAVPSGQATGGPFLNHSHFAQYMNLSLGCAIALLLLHLDQLPRHRHHRSSRAAALARPLTLPIRLLALGIIAMAVSIPLSLSRGGMLSMLAAGIFTSIVLATRRGLRGRTWLFVGLAVAVLAATLLLEWDAVFRRASRVGDPHSLHGRLDIARGSMQALRSFPLLGTGLGSFQVVFPMYDPSTIASLAEHADNDYAQILVETGAVGMLIVLGFLGLIGLAFLQCVRTSPSPMASAAIGLGYGIVAILLNSATDFGQHIPANFVLSAFSFAMIVNLSHAARQTRAPMELQPFRGARMPRIVGMAAAAIVAAIVLTGSVQTWRASLSRRNAAQVETLLSAAGWKGDDYDFARLIDSADRAWHIRPRNVFYRFDVNYFRWKALARPLMSDPPQPLSDTDRAHLRRVVDELAGTARLCPTYAPPYLLAGQILRNALNDPAGAPLIRTAHRLHQNNPVACIEVAILDGEESRWDEAMAGFRRAAALRPEFLPDGVDALLDPLQRPDLALDLARDDMQALTLLASRLRISGQSPEIARHAAERARQLVLERAARPGASATTLAEAAYVCLQQGQPRRAVDFFRQALSVEFTQTQWRMDLAQTLVSLDQVNEALNEAHTVLRITPSNAAAAKLISDHTPKPRAPETQPSTAPAPSTGPTGGFRFN
jgi:O-antigen ligase/tetratricopeptide (TPR) repeat protein